MLKNSNQDPWFCLLCNGDLQICLFLLNLLADIFTGSMNVSSQSHKKGQLISPFNDFTLAATF